VPAVTLEIRPLTMDDDVDAFGVMVLRSYEALPGHPHAPGYDEEILDVARRVTTDVVLGAFWEGQPVGCVTYVNDPSSPHAELLGDDEASFRMLAVDTGAQGRGVGDALVAACLDRARAAERRAVFISSGVWMHAAHRLYERHGFTRDPTRDRFFEAIDVTLWGFRRPLT
jgi:ribosomal protein S18 acetylase RimI-like enzyme